MSDDYLEEPHFEDDEVFGDNLHAEPETVTSPPPERSNVSALFPAPRPAPEQTPEDEDDDLTSLLSEESAAPAEAVKAEVAQLADAEGIERLIQAEVRTLTARAEAKRRFAELPAPDEPDRGTPNWLNRVKERYPREDLAARLLEPLPPVVWLEEGFIAQGDYTSITSDAKAGKSLLMYWLTINWARGTAGLTEETALANRQRVLYLDAENGQRWQHTKINAFDVGTGFADHFDVINFPTLPALDTPEGGRELLATVDTYRPDVLVLDTVSRYIGGNENDAATWLAFYRNSIMPIRGKYPNLTIIRLDHFGKDKERSARGSSAKMSDIDANFELHVDDPAARNTIRVHCERARNDHYEEFAIQRADAPLRHTRLGGIAGKVALAKPVARAIDALDELEVPIGASVRTARARFKAAGIKCGTTNLGTALAFRQQRGTKLESATDTE